MPAGFRALDHYGYRLYFIGMLLRGTAVWMQLIGLPWYAVELGATPFELGLVTAIQTLPFLLIAPIGGVFADRVDRALVLQLAQIGVFIQSTVMVGLIVSGAGTIPIIVFMGGISGTLIAIELPVRQTYLVDLVPPEDVTSAVSLHSTAFNTTRFVGPGIAGILIATVGVQAVFATAARVRHRRRHHRPLRRALQAARPETVRTETEHPRGVHGGRPVLGPRPAHPDGTAVRGGRKHLRHPGVPDARAAVRQRRPRPPGRGVRGLYGGVGWRCRRGGVCRHAARPWRPPALAVRRRHRARDPARRCCRRRRSHHSRSFWRRCSGRARSPS